MLDVTPGAGSNKKFDLLGENISGKRRKLRLSKRGQG